MTDSPTPIESALAHAGLDRMPDTPEAAEAIPATRWAVVSGDTIRLILSDDCNALASLVLAPAEIIGLSADLLAAARVRVGR